MSFLLKILVIAPLFLLGCFFSALAAISYNAGLSQPAQADAVSTAFNDYQSMQSTKIHAPAEGAQSTNQPALASQSASISESYPQNYSYDTNRKSMPSETANDYKAYPSLPNASLSKNDDTFSPQDSFSDFNALSQKRTQGLPLPSQPQKFTKQVVQNGSLTTHVFIFQENPDTAVNVRLPQQQAAVSPSWPVEKRIQHDEKIPIRVLTPSNPAPKVTLMTITPPIEAEPPVLKASSAYFTYPLNLILDNRLLQLDGRLLAGSDPNEWYFECDSGAVYPVLNEKRLSYGLSGLLNQTVKATGRIRKRWFWSKPSFEIQSLALNPEGKQAVYGDLLSPLLANRAHNSLQQKPLLLEVTALNGEKEVLALYDPPGYFQKKCGANKITTYTPSNYSCQKQAQYLAY